MPKRQQKVINVAYVALLSINVSYEENLQTDREAKYSKILSSYNFSAVQQSCFMKTYLFSLKHFLDIIKPVTFRKFDLSDFYP